MPCLKPVRFLPLPAHLHRSALVALLLPALWARGQRTQPPVPGTSAQKVSQRSTAPLQLAEAQAWIGRALILRGFYGGASLQYDSDGHLKGSPIVLDWTLAGMNLDAVSESQTGAFELEGTRVAIRYNPGTHTFDRHPVNNEPIVITLAPAADAASLRRALQSIFSIGIDPDLQHSMPDAWRHYFQPNLEWRNDALTGQNFLKGNRPQGTTEPVAKGSAAVHYTPEARLDKVEGVVTIRLVIDQSGHPQRIAILTPLGYGLDAAAVKALAQQTYTPGEALGQPVSIEITVNQQFQLSPAPAR